MSEYKRLNENGCTTVDSLYISVDFILRRERSFAVFG